MVISVLIVTYNSADLIKHCIDSLLRQKEVELDVIVIDNDSQDQTVSVLESYKDQIRFMASSQNLGFGKANNLAAQMVRGEWIFLLNPDTELRDEFALKKILQYALSHPEYGLIGPRIISPSGHKETKPFDFYPGGKYIRSHFKQLPGEIAWVLGACMFLSREVYNQVRGFDEDYFLYGEDTDLCLRVRRLGYEIGYDANVVVHHVGGASEAKANDYERTMRKQKAWYLFCKKHYTPAEIIFLSKRYRCVALYRLCFYAVLSFITFGRRGRFRYDHYKAIYDSNCQYLEEHQ